MLPGVGAFTDAMTTMEETGQADALRSAVAQGVPFLGICLGVHLLFDWGDEGQPEGERLAGLGVLPGHVERMAAIDANGKKHKVPHVGWNSVEFVDGFAGHEAAARLFDGIDDGGYFYFTHSYCAVPDDTADLVATSEHARRFAAAVARDNVFGVQFHPEKSSHLGLQLLENFGKIVEASRR
ncbi:MAG: imidazole glycerol phosphate synthase subunit HisH [Coriobacteriales bacterium]